MPLLYIFLSLQCKLLVIFTAYDISSQFLDSYHE